MHESGYRAFISYSHADASTAAWLQRSIETYRLPQRLASRHPHLQGGRVGSVFRDREELPAGGDLGALITDALSRSDFLIVVCSPEARSSRWVDLEIEAFRSTHPTDRILCLIASGVPGAANEPGREDEECFPRALGYTTADTDGRPVLESVAADLRSSGDGRRLAKLKIIAGLLGIGLDEVIQRDAQRRQRRLVAVSVLFAIGMFSMSALSLIAIDARNDEALRRAEAEDLIEFMLTDLRDRLDAVGRLDVLDAVGEKAVGYYSKGPLSEHSESSLGRRARAFLLLGEVDDLRGDTAGARAAFQEAHASTNALLGTAPDDPERIFNHAQSEFWVGYLDWRLGDLEPAEAHFHEYLRLATRLAEIDPENVDWVTELGNANVNLGVYALDASDPAAAVGHFETAAAIFYEARTLASGGSRDLDWLVAQTTAYLADAQAQRGRLAIAVSHRTEEISIYGEMLDSAPRDQDVLLSMLTASIRMAELTMELGDTRGAITGLERAQAIARDLMTLDDENTFVKREAVNTDLALAEALAHWDARARSRQLIQQAETMAAELHQLDTAVLDWRLVWCRTQLSQGRLAIMEGDAQEAISRLDAVFASLSEAQSESARPVSVATVTAEAHFYRSQASAIQGDPDSAVAQLRRVIDEFEGLGQSLGPRHSAMLRTALQAVRGTDDPRYRALDASLREMRFAHPEFVGI